MSADQDTVPEAEEQTSGAPPLSGFSGIEYTASSAGATAASLENASDDDVDSDDEETGCNACGQRGVNSKHYKAAHRMVDSAGRVRLRDLHEQMTGNHAHLISDELGLPEDLQEVATGALARFERASLDEITGAKPEVEVAGDDYEILMETGCNVSTNLVGGPETGSIWSSIKHKVKKGLSKTKKGLGKAGKAIGHEARAAGGKINHAVGRDIGGDTLRAVERAGRDVDRAARGAGGKINHAAGGDVGGAVVGAVGGAGHGIKYGAESGFGGGRPRTSGWGAPRSYDAACDGPPGPFPKPARCHKRGGKPGRFPPEDQKAPAGFVWVPYQGWRSGGKPAQTRGLFTPNRGGYRPGRDGPPPFYGNTLEDGGRRSGSRTRTGGRYQRGRRF